MQIEKIVVGGVEYDVGSGRVNVGRFLSGWDCETGMPISFPEETPYTYLDGDFYIVKNISETTNYKPNGDTFDGTASTTEDMESPNQNDMYFYDGSVWLLFRNTSPVMDDYYTKEETNDALEEKVDKNHQSLFEHLRNCDRIHGYYSFINENEELKHLDKQYYVADFGKMDPDSAGSYIYQWYSSIAKRINGALHSENGEWIKDAIELRALIYESGGSACNNLDELINAATLFDFLDPIRQKITGLTEKKLGSINEGASIGDNAVYGGKEKISDFLTDRSITFQKIYIDTTFGDQEIEEILQNENCTKIRVTIRDYNAPVSGFKMTLEMTQNSIIYVEFSVPVWTKTGGWTMQLFQTDDIGTYYQVSRHPIDKFYIDKVEYINEE